MSQKFLEKRQGCKNGFYVVISQARMLKRLGRKGGDASDKEMAEKYEKHLKKVGEWLSHLFIDRESH